MPALAIKLITKDISCYHLNHMNKLQKLWVKHNFSFWRKIINAWTFIFFILIIIDFLYGNAIDGALDTVSSIYIGVLAIYVSNKEFERWYDRHEESHPGEAFVFIWTALVAGLLIIDVSYGNFYKIPSAVISSYIAVLTILVITNKSKSLYKLKRVKRK